jgi:hypothetical protein
MVRVFFVVLCIVFSISLIGCSQNKQAEDGKPSPTPTSPKPTVHEKKWYEGGTLHKATALEWQNATYDNKMATCADFFAALYQGKDFKQSILSSIKSTDDMVPYVEKLVADMDIALSKESNPKKNRMMYANQSVSEVSVMLMVMNGWMKPK